MDINQIQETTVLIRVNYDLPNLQATDRILDSKNTIAQLLTQNNKVVLLTHWGRPKGKDMTLSCRNLLPKVQAILETEVEFIDHYQGFTTAKQIIESSSCQVFLLENTRFHTDEQSTDLNSRATLANQYAELGQAFVDEAFAVSHRQEVTNSDIKGLLPTYPGLSYQREIDCLERLKSNPQRPLIFVMGGSKLETKLPVITKLIDKVDKFLIGGTLCFTFLQATKDLNMDDYHNVTFGQGTIEADFLETARQLLTTYPNKFVLPTDFVFGDSAQTVTTDNSLYPFDIGSQTLTEFAQHLSIAKAIFWNGTMGYYEKRPFDQGTDQLARVIVVTEAWKVVGGGDTVEAIEKYKTGFDYVSMGGGATLEYLSN